MKTEFSGNKTLDQHLGASPKNIFLASFTLPFLHFSCKKLERMELWNHLDKWELHDFRSTKPILTSVCNVQHPNSGQNTQQ